MSAVIDRVENHLIHEDVSKCHDFDDLKALIEAQLPQWAGNAAAETQMSFLRRLEAGAARVGHLIRGKIEDPARHRIDWKNKQITLVDIHNLHDRAKRLVIGVMLRRMFEDKEKTGTAQPLVFVDGMSIRQAARRLTLKRTQEQVRERLGVTSASVYNVSIQSWWESYDSKPSVAYIPAIVEFLGYDPLPTATTLAGRLVRHREISRVCGGFKCAPAPSRLG